MPLHRASRDPDYLSDVCGEVAFAPKELKVAQDLSERLGAYTYAGRATSRPTGLSSGHRSQTESDHRRPLMLPQELIQMPPERLIVLRAGLPPVRGRKIVYWRERAFRARLMPPPIAPPRPVEDVAPVALPSGPAPAGGSPATDPTPTPVDPLVLALPDLPGLGPLPPEGATAAEVEAWVDRYIDTTAKLPAGAEDHGR